MKKCSFATSLREDEGEEEGKGLGDEASREMVLQQKEESEEKEKQLGASIF